MVSAPGASRFGMSGRDPPAWVVVIFGMAVGLGVLVFAFGLAALLEFAHSLRSLR